MKSTIVEPIRKEKLEVGLGVRELNSFEEIIEKRILPKSSIRKLLGFGRSFKIPISNFPDTEFISILSDFGKFEKLIGERIKSSIPASFPKIELKAGSDSTIMLEIGNPNSDMAAEWKWK